MGGGSLSVSARDFSEPLWAAAALARSLAGSPTLTVEYYGIKSCLAAQAGSKCSLPTQARPPHLPRAGFWGNKCHGTRGQDGTTDSHGPDRTQILGPGGVQTGLVRELSYCKAKFSHDASRSEVNSGSSTADLGAA